jgi:hypothetical protein
MRVLVAIALVFAMLHGCGGDDDATSSPDAASSPQSDAGPEQPAPRQGKLERPELPRPPDGTLPDELRPPR